MALTQISTQGIKDGTITGTDLATDFTTTGDFTFTGDTSVIRFDKSDDALEFADNMKATFGNSGDLAIFHNGTYSRIEDVGTGHFELTTNGTSIDINKGTTEYMARFFTDGAVELYHDNSKKFETTTNGAEVTGRLMTDGVFIGDGGNNDVSLSIGSNNDLRLYHEGNHSYIIDRGTGELRIGSDSGIRLTKHDSETVALFDPDGAVELYYDNSKKFDTTSTGVALHGLSNGTGNSTLYYNSITGQVLYGATPATDLVSDTSPQLGGDLDTNSFEILLDDNHAVKFGNDTDLTVLHSGSTGVLNCITGDLHIKTTGSGDDIILISNDDIELQPQAGEAGIKVIGNGAVELYHDNSKKFETHSTGIMTQGTGQVSLIVGSTNAGGAAVFLDGDSNGDVSGGDYSFIRHNTSGNLEIVANKPSGGSSIDFYANGGNLFMQLTSNGHLIPYVNNSYDLGTSSKRWRNIYTNDLNLSNEGSSNDVDGTWGSYTIQEGAEDLFLVNKRSGKKYKFNLTEVS